MEKQFLDVAYDETNGRYIVTCTDDKQPAVMFLSREVFYNEKLMSAWLNSLYSMAHHNAPRAR